MKKKYAARRFIALLLTATIFSVTVLTAQASKTPADTGRIKWGHTEFAHYSYPEMCDRAGIELYRYYTRFPKIDTSLGSILDSTINHKEIPEDVKNVVTTCIAQFSPDNVPVEQLWGYLRSLLLLGDDQKATVTIERLINDAKDSLMKDSAYSYAISILLNNVPTRLDLAQKYIDRLDNLYPTPSPSVVSARLKLLSYWNSRYYKDSIRKYADEAIVAIHKMHPANQDVVEVLMPFIVLINLANDEGSIADQQKYLDSMSVSFPDWRFGRVGIAAASVLRSIEHRRSIYNKKAKPITVGSWYNTNGVEWPVIGKASLIVLVNHACGHLCWSQYETIKNIAAVFGDDVHITLAAQTSGFTIGSYVLDEKSEGDSIVKFFSNVYNMNYAVLLDHRPKHLLPDGRIIRDSGPVAELFNDWDGISAILTDKNGRIQWTGTLSDNSSRRPVISTIRRLLKAEQQ